LIQGAGDVVAEGATIVVNYEGVNWNTGEVFDSSFDRGSPATFGTAEVIAGFRDGLVGQKIGSRVIIIIPSDLGYGDAGSGELIKGGDTILFVVDILGVQ
jgi:peptidylprolyl isomerase